MATTRREPSVSALQVQEDHQVQKEKWDCQGLQAITGTQAIQESRE